MYILYNYDIHHLTMYIWTVNYKWMNKKQHVKKLTGIWIQLVTWSNLVMPQGLSDDLIMYSTNQVYIQVNILRLLLITYIYAWERQIIQNHLNICIYMFKKMKPTNIFDRFIYRNIFGNVNINVIFEIQKVYINVY